MDFTNPAWQEVLRFANSELVKSRIQNDSVKLTVEETYALRGRIAVFKELLALPVKARAQIEAEAELTGQ